MPDFRKSTEEAWAKEGQTEPKLPKSVTNHVNGSIRDHYAWADGLADYYANLYRSSFTLNYIFGVVAVLLALLGYIYSPVSHESGLSENAKHQTVDYIIEPPHLESASGSPQPAEEIKYRSPPKIHLDYGRILAGLEFVVILLIVLNTWQAKRRHWHKRSIDYRLLAEHLRLLRFLAPLGRGSVSYRLPGHLSYGDPAATWMRWHFHAIIREMGLVSARFDKDYLEANRQLILKVLIGGQIDYHKRNTSSSRSISHRLHWFGVGCFCTTLVPCLLHLADLHIIPTEVLLLLAALLPALGASVAAIRNQAEFERVAQGSLAMEKNLEQHGQKLERLSLDQPLASHQLGNIGTEVSQLMIGEVLDWRIVFQAKPVDIP